MIAEKKIGSLQTLVPCLIGDENESRMWTITAYTVMIVPLQTFRSQWSLNIVTSTLNLLCRHNFKNINVSIDFLPVVKLDIVVVVLMNGDHEVNVVIMRESQKNHI